MELLNLTGVLLITLTYQLINRVIWPENLRIRGHVIGLGADGDIFKLDLTGTTCEDMDWTHLFSISSSGLLLQSLRIS
jgi:hypothetical protein